MVKKSDFNILIVLILFICSSFIPLTLSYNSVPLKMDYNVSNTPSIKPIDIVYLKKDFVGFKEFLGFKESGGSYIRVNKFGYMGKYQFNLNTLKMFKIKDASKFLSSPELQERIFLIHSQRNKWILRKDIKWFVGSKINGTEITVSGILAAAHLSGPGNVKKYLRGNGKNDFKDAFGTSISKYMELFKNYDVSTVKAIRKPKV